ncbi:MAG: M14 family zinc carboxypeptidase [Planctomycetota bacterium]
MHPLNSASLVFALGVLPAQAPEYFTNAEMKQEIDALAAQAPGIAMAVDLTQLPGAARTHNGSSIWALKVSDGVALDEDEPALLLVAQHHSNELNTAPQILHVMQQLVNGYGSDPGLTAVVDNYETYLVPIVNPDGVDYVWSTSPGWRKNRRPNGGGSFGVDLNRNYSTLWSASCGGSTRTTSSTYRGPAAESEPEVRTLLALVQAIRPEVYLDFHSFGREVLHTYAPCAVFGASIDGLIRRYADDLRGPMNYGFRDPSASGEAPEDLWNDGGTMSLLIEVGTSQQPPWSSSVSEVARVWPGLRRAITTWEPAVRGHVRALGSGAPIAATIDLAPNPYQQGEVTNSRQRDGRYGLWLPLGTWDVRFAAPGFQPATRRVNVTAYDQAQALDVELAPVGAGGPTIALSGTPRLGQDLDITYTSPSDGGLVYWVPLSAGTSPGIPLGAAGTIPLNPDSVFFISVLVPSVVANNTGVLPASAQVTATFPIPTSVGLVGLTLYTGGITFNPGTVGGIKTWSSAASFTIQS